VRLAHAVGGQVVRLSAGSRDHINPLDLPQVTDTDGQERVRELVELPMKYPEVFAQLRIEPPRGILLYGPPGTGKTLIARAVASEVKAHFIHLNGPEIIHKFYGESEAKLWEVFDEAQREAPSIIFFDELDAIAPKRHDTSGDVEKRVVAQLLGLMDGLVSRGDVVVIGATNAPELLDPALRRPGRFDREIGINVPNRPGRLTILRIHARGMPLADDVDLERLADVTHGFAGADLAMLCKEAGMRALQALMASDDLPEVSSEQLARRARVGMAHFLDALRAIEPTATREFFVEHPITRWADIGGLDDIRELLLSLVQLPHAEPELFRQTGIRTPRAVLLSGPPGTGKSLMARALAAETGYSFLTADAATLLSKWVGESEKALRQVFRKARLTAPCIVLFDDVDALVPIRQGGADSGGSDRLVTQFLHELDELSDYQEILVLGATNRLDLVDAAALRPGRFDLVVQLDLPNRDQRLAIFAVHTRALSLADDVDLRELADRAEGLGGAEIAAICQQAALDAIGAFSARRSHGQAAGFQVEQRQFLAALESIQAGRIGTQLARRP
jgi:transitional endoplasmic reticulum ATPase